MESGTGRTTIIRKSIDMIDVRKSTCMVAVGRWKVISTF